jgi:hypothetical protein
MSILLAKNNMGCEGGVSVWCGARMQAAAGACACLGLGVRMLQQPVKLLLITAE